MDRYQHSDIRPEAHVDENFYGMRKHTINYAIEEYGEGWRYKSVTLKPDVWDYGSAVAALVNAEYSNDEMQAIVNNYLADPTEPTAAEEMAQMQAWRREAKAIAHSLGL